MTLDTLTPGAFSECIGQTFRLHLDPLGWVEAELIDVTPAGSRTVEAARAVGRREPFSIVLRAPGDRLAPQRSYTLENERLGRLDVFLVPIGPDALGMRYEAVFG